MGNRVIRGMVIRIPLIFVILNLESGGDSLPTEGYFIPSGAAGDYHGHQIQMVGFNYFTHHLS
jgi:hypothetical protein